MANDGDYVLAADIPTLIAEKFEPIPEYTERTLENIEKGIPIDAMNYRARQLSNADVELLTSVFKDCSLDFNNILGCTESEYKLFQIAFDSSENKPDWDIFPTFTNHLSEALNRQWNLCAEHSIQLERAAKNGEIKILSKQRIPLTTLEPGAIISREHAEKYLKELGLSLPDAPSQNGETVGNDDEGSQDDTEPNERGYTVWLRKTWVKENCTTGAPFFNALKKYKGKEDSLVIDWWNFSTKGLGVKLKTNTGEIELSRVQIQKIVSKFRREEKERKNLSSDN
ncbi:MAG: hypothetical protein M0R41_06300 [Methylobacter tundripaludum]|uniref:Uncharacterized protein n=1 Tax=Methylobacter tundripaludum TaxID=173365 RepID=A0A2S6GRC4_9GAMM|nr:hypothetical protein [Methylobacter tundripaludum]MCK9635870.1 hypothetical protein [Methylobacter tundripaludum]PPK67727.1 hypothetical protein B0F88_11367 [Methylobacter tundripaludum]